MFCPVCKSEYIETFTRCGSCDIDLVNEIPVPDVDMKQMVPVLTTDDRALLAAFGAALTTAGVPHFIRGAEAASLIPTDAVVVVPRDYLDEARTLLFVAENSRTGEEVGA